jgi:hypothetical protein
MVEGGYLEHGRFLQRFHDVIDAFKFERADTLVRMARHFNEVERDWYVVDETLFEFDPEIFRY